MAVTREVLAQRIQVALADAHMTQAELARILGIDPSALSRALSGQRNFKSLELALIAEALNVPTASFLDEAPPAAPLVAARAQLATRMSVAPALRVVDEFLDLDNLLNELGFGSSPIPGFAVMDRRAHTEGELLASALRERLNLGHDDLPYDLAKLAVLLEDGLGIDIAFVPDLAGLDGLSISRGSLHLAVIASCVSATRQRFTLAHEVAHLLMGDSQDLKLDETVFAERTHDEQRANSFAAAFLMPAEAIRNSLHGGFASEEVVAELLGRFGVSLDALAYRMHNVGVINAKDRERIRSMSSTRIALRSGRASDLQARNERRAPGNLLLRAADAYVAGKISIRPLASLLKVEPERLLDELSPPVLMPLAENADFDSLELAL